MNNFLSALTFSLLAGLSTGIGGLLSVWKGSRNNSFLAFVLGFSAGFMLYVSFVEILKESVNFFLETLSGKNALIFSTMAFFVGILIVVFIELAFPLKDSFVAIDSCVKTMNQTSILSTQNKSKLLRSGIITAVIVAVHNMPEGIITFMSALNNSSIAVTIILAISIHNIPEGIAVAVQIYHATNNRKKAISYSFLSGLTEPMGALIGYFILLPYLNNIVYGMLFGIVAGIMVFISIYELLLNAFSLNKHAFSITGFILGMFMMALSLLLF